LKIHMKINTHTTSLAHAGLEILQIKVGDLTILDTLNYLPMGLAALPKAFSLQAVKGYFPHFFNKRENYGYRGALPGKEFYGMETMKAQPKADFEKWHEEKSKEEGYEFDMWAELLRYCEADVSILRQAAMKFRQLLLDQEKIDPFKCAVTLPGTCMATYCQVCCVLLSGGSVVCAGGSGRPGARGGAPNPPPKQTNPPDKRRQKNSQNYLRPFSIGVIPYGGYERDKRHSIAAIKWLKWVAHSEDLNIQHAHNGGEAHIGLFMVDGQDRNDRHQVFEFNGCAFHGCTRFVPTIFLYLTCAAIIFVCTGVSPSVNNSSPVAT
jgi:hypothetical protein